MKNFLQAILNTLFPPKASVEALEHLAQTGKLALLPHAPEAPYPWIRALFAYKDTHVRELVWEIKYSGNNVLIKKSTEMMADEIVSIIEEKGMFMGNEWILLAIPASKIHEKEKGFNQTEELCKSISKDLDSTMITYMPKVIQKIRETTPQAQMKNRSKRLVNLKNSFAVSNISIVKGKNVILIDDVTTTGSTFVEAKRALSLAGAKEIIAIALAH